MDFLKFLYDVSPWLCAIAAAIFATWKISKYHQKLEETNNKVSDLPCASHKEEMKKSSHNYQSLQEKVTSTNDMVVEISKWIMKFDNNMIDSLAKKASPLRMTPLGEELFKECGAGKAIDGHVDFLISELEANSPKTPYDVENLSLSILLKNIGHDMFNEIKNFLYYSPDKIKLTDPDDQEEKEIELSMQSIIKLMSIYLRDKYLDKHSEIHE